MSIKINANFEKPIGVHTQALDWIASPMPGVERRMLDRVGDEVARATSLVRYAKGSQFSEHTHDGGEEFIVLEGVFQDEHGDYPSGTYVRNPIGTHHVPRSEPGCVIFVKLWQFDQTDTQQLVLDLEDQALEPVEALDGVSRSVLHHVPSETVLLEALVAGATRPVSEAGGFEALVLDGSIEWGGQVFNRHDWLRIPAGHSTALAAGAQGARLWIKTGHLLKISAPQA